MLALGGLIQEQTNESEQKIPILGDIPVLGHLFKSTNTTTGKNQPDGLHQADHYP